MRGTMRRARWWRTAAAGVAAVGVVPAAYSATVTSDLAQQYQTIDGFGTNLAWFRDDLGPNRSQYNSDAFYDLYYDDMGGSVLRMEMQYTVLSTSMADQPSFAELSAPINMVADTYANIAKFNFDAYGVGHVGRFVEQAATRAPDGLKVHAAYWSPPHWMKGEEVNWNDGQPNGKFPSWTQFGNSSGGSLIDTPQNLEQFGRYTAAYVKGFEQRFGEPIHSLSIQNEPAFRQTYNSAVYSPDLFVKALKAVRDAFDAHNAANPNDPILTELVGPDHIGIGTVNFAFFGEQSMAYVNAVNDDPAARDAMDFWGMHGFAGGIGFDGGSSATRTWPTFFDGRQPEDGFNSPYWEGAGRDKKLWITEHSEEEQAWLTPDESDRKGGLGLGMKMFHALVSGDASAYLYWQTQIGDRAIDVPLQLTDDEDPDVPKFAAFRHFSKHVRPDAVRFDVTDDDPLLYATGFQHDADGTLTYVLLNLDTNAETVTLDLPDGLDITGASAVVSEDGSYYAAAGVNLTAADATVVLPAESMLTLVLDFATGLPGDFNDDGIFDQGDLNLVLNNWGTVGTPAGWVNQVPVGVVDQGELNIVLNNWGATSSPDFAGRDVPEPACLSLLALTALRRRRRAA